MEGVSIKTPYSFGVEIKTKITQGVSIKTTYSSGDVDVCADQPQKKNQYLTS